jgi:hypothetical protein
MQGYVALAQHFSQDVVKLMALACVCHIFFGIIGLDFFTSIAVPQKSLA